VSVRLPSSANIKLIVFSLDFLTKEEDGEEDEMRRDSQNPLGH